MRSIITYKNGIILWIILLSSLILLLSLHYQDIFIYPEQKFKSILHDRFQPSSIASSKSLSTSADLSLAPSPLTSSTSSSSLKSLQTSSSSATSLTLSSHSTSYLHYYPTNLDQQASMIKNMVSSFQSRYLILGIAHDTDIKNIAIFMGSLRQLSPEIECLIFVNDLSITSSSPSPSSSIKDKKHIPTLEELSSLHRIHLLGYNISVLEPVYLRKYHPSSLRWIFYHQLFTSSSDMKYAVDHVVVADVRDTAFQINPFHNVPNPPQDYFYAFQEDSVPNIGSCGWNSGWIKDCFHASVFHQVSNNPISCSGISIASTNAMMIYLHIFSSILFGETHILANHFPTCERNGVDQGIHNIILGLNMIHSVSSQFKTQTIPTDSKLRSSMNDHHLNHSISHMMMNERTYPVTNLQHSQLISSLFQGRNKEQFLSQASATYNYLLNDDHHLFSIVHQYDRVGELQLTYAKKFISWVDFTNPYDEFKHDHDCQSYTYQQNVEFFRGKCDIGSYRGLTLSSCCRRCHDHPRTCYGFSYVDGMCWFKGGSSCSYNSLLRSYLSTKDQHRAQNAVTVYSKDMS